ncbi:MAG: hypothetical protein ACO1RX_15220 [Candidatus Sericytochromatia bacterium]
MLVFWHPTLLRTLSSILLLGSPLLISTSSAADFQTQQVQMGQWETWTSPAGYRLKLPKELHLQTETNQSWRANGLGMGLKITTWKNAQWSAQQVANHPYQNWPETTNKEITRSEDISAFIAASGAKGHMLEGKGIQSDRVVRFAIVGIAHARTGGNMTLRFAWYHDPSKNAQNEALVERIVSSLEAAGPPVGQPPAGSDDVPRF